MIWGGGFLGLSKTELIGFSPQVRKCNEYGRLWAYLCIMCEHNYVNKQMPADWANFDSLWNEYRWNDYRDEGLKYIRKIQKISSNPWAHYTILHIKLFISTFARRYMAISGTSTGGTVPYKDMWSHILVVYRLHTGFFKITTILSNSWRRNLHAPFPPSQCCYIALLGKAFKKNSHCGSDAGMHWATTLIKGARGDQVWCDHMQEDCRFFEELGEDVFYFMDVQTQANTQAWTNSLCICQNLNPK